jgi:phage protein D
MAELTYVLKIDRQPASDEVMDALRLVEVEQRCDAAAIFRLRFALAHEEKGDYHPLDDDLFKPLTPVTIQATLDAGQAQTLIEGYVSDVQVHFGEESLLEVVGMDATATLMNLEEKVRAWPNMADSDIASMIFSEYSLTPEVTATQPARMAEDVTVIQRGTDIRFLRQLAERNGFQCLITYGQGGVATGYFGPPKADAEPQGILSVNWGSESTVTEFSVQYAMLAPTGATATGLDVEKAEEQTGEAPKGEVAPMGATGTLDALSEKSLVLLSGTGLMLNDELKTAATAAADRSAWAVTAQGTVDPRRLATLPEAGKPVLVRGAGKAFSGAYLVDRVLYEFEAQAARAQFTLKRNATGLKGSEVFR